MDTRRQLKVASLIKEAFSEILYKEGRSIYGTALVTVTNAKVTSDLTLARFYLSIYNAEEPDEVLYKFNEHKTELKRLLADKLRHHIRRIPEIEFFRDETMDYVFKMEELFTKIKQEDEQLKEEIGKKKAVEETDEPKEKKTRTPRKK